MMIERLQASLKYTALVVLAAAMILSANARVVAHDPGEIAKIVADHHQEIKHHGHAHEDIADILQAYHGHGHETADHDHNIAFLPPREQASEHVPNKSRWVVVDHGTADFSGSRLDRPPRT